MGWEFSLILLCFIPLMAGAGLIYGKAAKGGMIDKMKAYG